jgi:hypothetical protein
MLAAVGKNESARRWFYQAGFGPAWNPEHESTGARIKDPEFFVRVGDGNRSKFGGLLSHKTHANV